MNYVNRLLQPGEEISYRTRMHPMVFIKPVLAAALAVFLANVLPDYYLPYVAALLLVICVPYAIMVTLSFLLGDIAVTNRRVLLRTGAMRGQMNEVLLHKVQAVAAAGGLAAGAGTVRIEIAGGVIRTVAFVRDAEGLAQAIDRGRKRMQAQSR